MMQFRSGRLRRGMAKTSNSCLGVIAGLAMAASFYSLPMGAMAGQWIKATFNGVSFDSGELKTDNGTDLSTFTPSILLYNYEGTNDENEKTWTQPGGDWSYYPLYGFGSFVGTNGFYGSAYNARNELLASPLSDTVSFSDSAGDTDVNFFTGRLYSGYDVYSATSYPNPVPLESISFYGTISGFVGFDINNTNTDVVSYIAQALQDSGQSTFSCASTCEGDLIPQSEGGFMFTWSSVTFEVVEAVPSPLPLVGAVAAFSYSRRLRKRVGSNRLAKIG